MGSSKSGDRRAYTEFGNNPATEAAPRPDPPPAAQPLKVQASRKGRKGKTVTVISGFKSSAPTLAQLTKQLKAHCGAGGTVKDDTIEIQGDHKQTVQQLLIKLGYPTKLSGG